LQFHLVEQALRPLGAGAVDLPPQLLDLQLLAGDQRLGIGLPRTRHGGLGLGDIGPGTLGEQRRLQRRDVVRQGVGGSVHDPDRITNRCRAVLFFALRPAVPNYPAACGRQVC
jgi:hypothetical protein